MGSLTLLTGARAVPEPCCNIRSPCWHTTLHTGAVVTCHETILELFLVHKDLIILLVQSLTYLSEYMGSFFKYYKYFLEKGGVPSFLVLKNKYEEKFIISL
jgi:hypothetical protein